MSFTNNQVRKIGKTLRDSSEDSADFLEAKQNLCSWREAHGDILNHYRQKCDDNISIDRSLGEDIVSRLKRLETILDKIRRPEHTTMNLANMQDIAGVRVIIRDFDKLKHAEQCLSNMPGLVKSNDYISNPKADGYRGEHFIFKKDDMLAEVQLRTYLQHLWATAVEMVDAFEGTKLKTSNTGDDEWRNFFKLASAIFSYVEGLPILDSFRDEDIINLACRLKKLMDTSIINDKLYNYTAVGSAFQKDNSSGKTLALISLCHNCTEATIDYYNDEEYQLAIKEYEKVEQEDGWSCVLVSAKELQNIRESYPNYFLNIGKFRDAIYDCLKQINII